MRLEEVHRFVTAARSISGFALGDPALGGRGLEDDYGNIGGETVRDRDRDREREGERDGDVCEGIAWVLAADAISVSAVMLSLPLSPSPSLSDPTGAAH
jgi:hypothetical protein